MGSPGLSDWLLPAAVSAPVVGALAPVVGAPTTIVVVVVAIPVPGSCAHFFSFLLEEALDAFSSLIATVPRRSPVYPVLTPNLQLPAGIHSEPPAHLQHSQRISSSSRESGQTEEFVIVTRLVATTSRVRVSRLPRTDQRDDSRERGALGRVRVALGAGSTPGAATTCGWTQPGAPHAQDAGRRHRRPAPAPRASAKPPATVSASARPSPVNCPTRGH